MSREPAVLATAVAAVINAVVVALGGELSTELQGAIILVVTALAGLVIRARVTPTG